MRVRELIKLLEQHAETNPEVLVTWESTIHPIDADNLYPSLDGPLMLDADGNHYQKYFQTEPGYTRR